MKRLLVLAAVTAFSITSLGCSQCGGNRSRLFNWNRGAACNNCETGMGYVGPAEGVVYDGYVTEGPVEEIQTPNRASTRGQ